MNLWEEIARRALRHGRQTAVRLRHESVTYDDLQSRVERCAAGMALRAPDAMVVLDASEPLAFLVEALAALAARRPAIIHTAGIPLPLREKRERAVAGRVTRDSTVFFSSGSVGAGKAIPLDPANLLFAALAYPPEEGGVVPTDRVAAGVPLGHIYGFVRGVLETLLSGAELVPFSPRRDPGGEAAALGANRVLLSARQILLTGRASGPLVLDCITSGGATVPETAVHAIEQGRGTPVRVGYGLTESTGVGTRQPRNLPRRPGSSGLPPRGVAVAIVDAAGEPLPADEDGEIRLTGPCVFSGYADPSEPAPFDEQGRLCTGDIGRIDEAGELVVRGRAAFSIVSHGRLLCAEEVEAAALGQPGVSDAAAVPLEGGFGLLLVTEDASESRLREIGARLARELPVFARPRWIQRTPEIPRSPAGKIDRSRAAHWLRPS